MNDFTRKLITEWRRLELPFEGENILIAVSGGADSCALAIGLAGLRDRKKTSNGFTIGHFNHKLRGEESDADAGFVEELAKTLGVKFVSGESERGLLKEGNLEQNARKARYRFLTETATELDCFAVLTAHTQNDQAETLLFNLIRGSGIEGLSGMRTVRKFFDDKGLESENKLLLVRPLLSWAKREETEKFVSEKGVSFREDTMNQDTRFSRVKIRKEVIPLLKEFNPGIVENLANTAHLLCQDAETLSELPDGEDVSYEHLPLRALKDETEAKLQRLLRKWLKNMRGDLRSIDYNHITAIVSLINSRKSGSVCELPRGEKVIKKNGELIFVGSEVEKRF